MISQFAFLDLGAPQLLIILAIVLLLFGSKKLPELSRSLGQSAHELRKGLNGTGDEKKTTKTTTAAKQFHNTDQKLPFLEHFYELKRRLTYVAVSVVGFSIGAYFVQQQIVAFLLRPAHGQNLIYTSPGGGLDFLFKVCLYTGLICSLPIIIYQFLKYFEPLLGIGSVRFALGGSFISAVLAVAGMAFGYYAGMPATLHFLFHQFTTSQIHPLIAVQSYMSFVTMYMFGAALLFQVPLLMIFINRIKPLKPSKLLKHERWMVLVAFVLAVIMNPTPNVVDQLMLAGPMVLTYNLGILIIALMNRPRYSSKVATLKSADAVIQAERLARAGDAREVWRQADAIAEHPIENMPVSYHKISAAVLRVATDAPSPAIIPRQPAVLQVTAAYSRRGPGSLPTTTRADRPKQYAAGTRSARPPSPRVAY